MTNKTLAERRHGAALLSGGCSGDPIYRLFRHVIVEHKLSGRALDWGAGKGNLTRLLRDIGAFHKIDAVDVLTKPKDFSRAVNWHQVDLNARTHYRPHTFDVVVAAEVIEHLENPRAVAREWYRLLRPGGTLLFSTPNNASLRSFVALIFRGHFVAFGDSSYPAHITALLEKDMERLVAEAGFSEVQFRYTDNGGLPGQPNVTWQSISLGRLGGRWFSDNVLCWARKPSRMLEEA